jgi:molecular chaperone DnaJ
MGGELYLILGVGESARESEIRKAYRRLARRYHPDINPGDRQAAEAFRRISEAYDVLADPEKRGFYDSHGYYAEPPWADAAPKARWDVSFGRGEPLAGGERKPGSGFEDVLEGFLGSSSGGEHGVGESPDVEARISLSFREAMGGLATEVDVTRRRSCAACYGDGRESSGQFVCEPCGGGGRLVRTRGQLRFSTTCSDCNGSGRVGRRCGRCGGSGSLSSRERLRVEIPPGVSSGSRVRFPGKGHINVRTGERGDLFVVTNVAADPFFRRVGDNLYCTLPITIPEAALGGKVPVPTLDGVAMLRIPPGVQPGQTLRLRGKGAPSLRAAGARGDQYVEVKVVVPRVVDERSREILRELARLNPEDPRKEFGTDAG